MSLLCTSGVPSSDTYPCKISRCLLLSEQERKEIPWQEVVFSRLKLGP